MVGVDHLDELVAMATANVSADPAAKELLDKGILELVTGDGRLGEVGWGKGK